MLINNILLYFFLVLQQLVTEVKRCWRIFYFRQKFKTSPTKSEPFRRSRKAFGVTPVDIWLFSQSPTVCHSCSIIVRDYFVIIVRKYRVNLVKALYILVFVEDG